MIPVDFEYRRPETLQGAHGLFMQLQENGGNPMYGGGGTEIVTRARIGAIAPSAVIDLKGIDALQEMGVRDGRLVLGAGLTLKTIMERDPWPLLSLALSRIADHTVRAHITLGGNLASTIPYREAVLPFLLVDSTARLFGDGGDRWVPLGHVFPEGVLQLPLGDFLVALSVPEAAARVRGLSVKKTRLDWVDYPLMTIVARPQRGRRVPALAVSGLTPSPFRASQVEHALLSADPVELNLQDVLPGAVVDDIHGSAAYREFVFRQTLVDVLARLEGAHP
jgi:CO/xanthine dehydrogenase FAD-binding subunit